MGVGSGADTSAHLCDSVDGKSELLYICLEIMPPVRNGLREEKQEENYIICSTFSCEKQSKAACNADSSCEIDISD